MDKYREGCKRRGRKKGCVCVFIVSFSLYSTLHPMLVLLTQAKRETQQTPSNTHGLGQLAYCKIEVTEPQAGKVDPLLVWSYVCICCETCTTNGCNPSVVSVQIQWRFFFNLLPPWSLNIHTAHKFPESFWAQVTLFII